METRRRTVYIRDAYGNRERDVEEFMAPRVVRSITPGPRFGHFVVDFIAFQVLILIVDYIFKTVLNATSFNFQLNASVGLIASIVLLLFYPLMYIVCESLWQKTPGKFLTKTRVIDEYGNKPEFMAIVFRSLIRVVPFDWISSYGDKYSHGWHDRWSKTWVVPDEEYEELRRLQSEQLAANLAE